MQARYVRAQGDAQTAWTSVCFLAATAKSSSVCLIDQRNGTFRAASQTKLGGPRLCDTGVSCIAAAPCRLAFSHLPPLLPGLTSKRARQSPAPQPRDQQRTGFRCGVLVATFMCANYISFMAYGASATTPFWRAVTNATVAACSVHVRTRTRASCAPVSPRFVSTSVRTYVDARTYMASSHRLQQIVYGRMNHLIQQFLLKFCSDCPLTAWQST